MKRLLVIMPGDFAKCEKGFEKLLHDRLSSYVTEKILITMVELQPIYVNRSLELTQLKIGRHRIKRLIHKHSMNDLFYSIVRIFKLTPLQCALYTNKQSEKYILNNQKNYDRILFITARSVQNIMPSEYHVDFVDSLSLNFYRKSQTTKRLWKKILYRYEAITMKMLESNIYSTVQKSFTVSSIDANTIGTDVIVNPLAIDSSFTRTSL